MTSPVKGYEPKAPDPMGGVAAETQHWQCECQKKLPWEGGESWRMSRESRGKEEEKGIPDRGASMNQDP